MTIFEYGLNFLYFSYSFNPRTNLSPLAFIITNKSTLTSGVIMGRILFFLAIYVGLNLLSYFCFNYKAEGRYKALKTTVAIFIGLVGLVIRWALVIYVFMNIYYALFG